MKPILSLFLLFAALTIMGAQTLTATAEGAFPLHGATICTDPADALVVSRAARMLADDVERVSGVRPGLKSGVPMDSLVVIVGTIDGNATIRQLASRGLLPIDDIRGDWERYVVCHLKAPLPGVSQALVVAGSDRRGAAYGALSISEAIGVSPWYWWADVPVEHRSQLNIAASGRPSAPPSVRYRGIFINDEDWGLQPWAANTFERDRGNIGPRTYAKVCELLLRLKANYLCPAMHAVSTAFNQIAENKLVADSFGIVMGSTHCEPLLLNTASEWHTDEYGPWDYGSNKDGILRVLGQRVEANAPYENVWTLALRGLHDAAMGVGVPMKEKVRLLQEALMDQRALLASHLPGVPIEQVPQAFTPYKEVLDIYSAGLELPDDVTIIWPDDNFGYMKRLSSPTEQQRSGRAGVYYHVSYLGVPHSYLWFSTTPTALMHEELRKAYDTGADRVWLVNCGDIKGCEPQVSFFLDMAWQIDRFTPQTAHLYQAQWLSAMFGQRHYQRFERLTTGLSNLAFARKPEFMGWGFWNNRWGSDERRTDTQFSFENYGEAERRLEHYGQLARLADTLLQEARPDQRAAMFELVYYPAKGAELMNRMCLGGQLYRKHVAQQRASAVPLRRRVEALHDSLEALTRRYDSLLDGKWRHMMSLRQDYTNHSAYFKVPRMEQTYRPDSTVQLAIEAEGQPLQRGHQATAALPTFCSYAPYSHWIDVFNQGTRNHRWTAWADQPWISLSASSGELSADTRLWVSIDWNRLPAGPEMQGGTVTISAAGQRRQVAVSAFRPALPAGMGPVYMEQNGCVAMPATGFHRKTETPAVRIGTLPGLGLCGSVLQIGQPTAPLTDYKGHETPGVEYDFYTFNAGLVDVYTYVVPTFPLHAERDFRLPEHTNSDTKYSISIDGGNIATPTTSAVEYSQAWYDAVLMNTRVNHSRLYVDQPGRHTLRLHVGDPGLLFQKIVIDLGGLRKSYQGPPCTQLATH